MNQPTLHHQLTALQQKESNDFFKLQVPSFLYQNLRSSLGHRGYQQEAFGRFIYYFNEYKKGGSKPLQLLYHMATGSGKTVVMAGLIIYLYNQGYRHFLFFVNSTNIIQKTKDNFINPFSSKYLFNDVLRIGGKEIRIRESTNFEGHSEDDIHLVFATIQGLHAQLNNPSENSLTYEDFEGKQIVLISDEAHHINAETKKSGSLTSDEKEELISWEATVRRLFTTNPRNILLEFTATVDFSLKEIAAKYNDKIIFDYSLKQFRQDGYSKNVTVVQSGQPLFERALGAVLLSQYRYKLFQKWGLFIKPVILFKSKTIKESEAFLEQFINGMGVLSPTELLKLKDDESTNPINRVFRFLAGQHISLENFIAELRADFSEEKLITVNSRDESEKKQLAVNTLEDEDNPYRAVFAVDKLNEGWDVLNLFDIVRLYDTADAAKSVLKKTTLSEAQLIGRGARYCPFRITEGQPLAQRKFDEEPEHELRICEELIYHSPYNPKYIHELNETLIQVGIKETEQLSKGRSEKNTPQKEKKVHNPPFLSQVYKVKTARFISSQSLFNNEHTALSSVTFIRYPLTALPPIIIRKAMDRVPFYYFDNLKKRLPLLRSANEFINSKNYLGAVFFEIDSELDALTAEQRLALSTTILEQIQIHNFSDQ